MSVEAITWALAQPVERSSAKFVLVAMANCAGPDMKCWPSMGYLTEATSQDRKTVIEGIKRLVASGFIEATEARAGRTGQVVVYRLANTEEDTQKRNSSETGTVPKTDTKSPVFPAKESRFSVETVPKTGHGTVKEPSRNQQPNTTPAAPTPKPDDWLTVEALAADGIDADLAGSWLAHRRAKKAKLTALAWRGFKSEADKAGWDYGAAVIKAISRNWTGFEAEWVKGGRSPAPSGKHSGFESKNYRQGVTEDGHIA